MNTLPMPARRMGQPDTAIKSLAAILPRRSRWGGDLFVMALALALATAFVAPMQHNDAATSAAAPLLLSTPDQCFSIFPGQLQAAPAQGDASCAAWPAAPAQLPWSATEALLPLK